MIIVGNSIWLKWVKTALTVLVQKVNDTVAIFRENALGSFTLSNKGQICCLNSLCWYINHMTTHSNICLTDGWCSCSNDVHRNFHMLARYVLMKI